MKCTCIIFEQKRTYFNVLFFNKNIKGTIGSMFPSTQIGKTVAIGSPIQRPTGIAPLSSTTGIAEMSASTAKSGSPNRRK